jgi:hypothetical protein
LVAAEPVARAVDPDGREVLLSGEGWGHIVENHPELAPDQELVMRAIARPDHRAPDERRGRERYFLRTETPSRWLRVVVDFSGPVAVVVTAFPERRDPPGWQTSSR